MAAIKSTGTKPEVFVRKSLHSAGFRFRLHRKDLPGNPDLVFPRFKLAIFVHGCFWHGHGCKKDHQPRTNRSYWLAKIKRNVERDRHARAALEALGWRVRIVWECLQVEETARLIEELSSLRASEEQSAL